MASNTSTSAGGPKTLDRDLKFILECLKSTKNVINIDYTKLMGGLAENNKEPTRGAVVKRVQRFNEEYGLSMRGIGGKGSSGKRTPAKRTSSKRKRDDNDDVGGEQEDGGEDEEKEKKKKKPALKKGKAVGNDDDDDGAKGDNGSENA